MKEILPDYLVNSGVLKSKPIIDAFSVINREDFIPEAYREKANIDAPIPIGFGQTNSQPTTVAFMLELLEPKLGQKILDVGSGSGWTTALLAQIVGPKGKVFGVERIPELVKFGQSALSKYEFPNTEIKKSGNELGLPQQAPFDRILVSATAEYFPQKLVEQLVEGGIMVIPIKNSVYKITKDKNGIIYKTEFPGFSFVPLIFNN